MSPVLWPCPLPSDLACRGATHEFLRGALPLTQGTAWMALLKDVPRGCGVYSTLWAPPASQGCVSPHAWRPLCCLPQQCGRFVSAQSWPPLSPASYEPPLQEAGPRPGPQGISSPERAPALMTPSPRPWIKSLKSQFYAHLSGSCQFLPTLAAHSGYAPLPVIRSSTCLAGLSYDLTLATSLAARKGSGTFQVPCALQRNP